MIDKELIHQAAEDIDIFEADLTAEYEHLCPQRPRILRLWPLAVAACVAGIIAFLLWPKENTPLPTSPIVAGKEHPQERPKADTKTQLPQAVPEQKSIAAALKPAARLKPAAGFIAANSSKSRRGLPLALFRSLHSPLPSPPAASRYSSAV